MSRSGCGSVSLCTQLVQAVADADDEVLYAWRSFEAYPIIAAVSGASSIQVPLDAGYVHDLDAMAERITGKTRLVFVCNPNNPTGTAVGRDELARASCGAVPDDVVVALDEAYREFVTDPEVPDGPSLLAEHPTWSCSGRSPRPTGWPGCGSVTRWPPTRRWPPRCARPRCRSRSVASRRQAALASLEPRGRKAAARAGGATSSAERARVHRRAATSSATTCRRARRTSSGCPLGERPSSGRRGCEERGVIVRAVRRPGCAGDDRHARGERPVPRRGRGRPLIRPRGQRRQGWPVTRGGGEPATPDRPAGRAVPRTGWPRRALSPRPGAPSRRWRQPASRPPTKPRRGGDAPAGAGVVNVKVIVA